jgi:NhaP-type Na+/H+ or K+/H+ antiporter
MEITNFDSSALLPSELPLMTDIYLTNDIPNLDL